jgi:hypothetical protein
MLAHPGEAFSGRYVPAGNKQSLEVQAAGEYYRVNCPFCGDTRHRLWINHMWGLRDPVTRSRNLWLAWCYNESHCLKDYEKRERLYHAVFVDPPQDDVVYEGERLEEEVGPAVMPGAVWRLSDLPSQHVARQYISQRRHDPDQLASYFDLRYCDSADPRWPLTQGRLIIPCYMRQELVGWQARLLGEPPNKFTPKYYTLPSMKKGRVLYNFDLAGRFRSVVIVEGPADVWRYGPEAVAIMGSHLSTVQKQLIMARWQGAVIMLDGDALDAAQGAYDALGAMPRALVALPDGRDPDECDTEYLRASCEAAALRAGFSLQVK